MARVKTGYTRRRRHRKILDAVKGHRGARRTRYRAAQESLIHSMKYATAHRRERKREMRSLWILRINAAARANGLSYSQLVYGLRLAHVEIDRKNLADLSVREPEAFNALASTAREALAA